MTLITGSAIGNLDTQEDLYLEGAPTITFQRNLATPLFNPDSDGFYYGMSGTTAYPAYEVGCVTDVSLSENLTMNDVLCDNVGVKSTVQQRNYLELTFTLQSFFPYTVLTHILKGGTVTQNGSDHTEKFGLGKISQNVYWMVWCPKVYDEDVGDYIAIHLHKAQFVDAFTINMGFGTPWQATGIKLRAFADTTKSTSQQFGVFLRSDSSVL